MLYTRRTFDHEAPLPEADICLLGIPFDAAEIGRPVRYGPLFIREAIKNLIGWDPDIGINIFESYRFCDLGDVEIVPNNWKLTEERILDTIRAVFSQNKNIFPVFLGGDHLITLAILRGLKNHYKEPITIVHIDAHPDLKTDWLGEPYSHISWASHILRDGGFDLIQIGCRIWDKDEPTRYIKKEVGKINGPVYLTIDLDVFDPAYAPDVGTPEPHGMTPEEVFSVVEQACKNNLIGFDLVECAADRLHTTAALLAAQLFKKILGWRLHYAADR